MIGDLNKIQIQKLTSKYLVGKLVSFDRIKKGFMNYSYVVRTGKGKFILRIGKKTKKEKDLLFEIRMLNHLKNLPVPRYVKGKKYVNRYKKHNYTIYRYLEGSTPKRVSKNILKQTAHFLARFHNQAKSYKTSAERFAWYTFPDEKIRKFKKHLLKNLEKHKDEILYIEKELVENRLPENLPSGPIHCDVKRENLLVKGNSLTGVIDFDNCQIGPFLLDLAISISWLCADWKGLDYKKTYKFVKNYEKYRKLNKLEKKHLFKAIKYACVSHEFVDYYVYTKGLTSKDYFQFGRKFFLNQTRKMDREKFKKYIESGFAFLRNLA